MSYSKVCIIGGSGFIGTRLAARLIDKSNISLKIADKIPSKSFPDSSVLCDVRFPEQLREAMSDCDVIINLAAEHRDDVSPLSLYEDVNVGGARNICTVAAKENIKTIIFTSSVAIYGFAPIGTDESGLVAPFNEYGRTKYEAEKIFKAWQAESPNERTLVVIRPTVVFGEKNRGNVYNLLKQISSGRFVMIGKGENRKSIAYVENVAAFIEYGMGFGPGVYVYNFVDKPDFTMNALVMKVNKKLGRSSGISFRLPFMLGYIIGIGFDLAAKVTNKNFQLVQLELKNSAQILFIIQLLMSLVLYRQ
ncbi:NAD-dependent epimerase/dehydratase family protein [Chromobacterium vaccinii]|uniref:NAD-dependent epimerase/dehydratase family protein n=1 Tax=Chromobacterium vaccinii TaxID=1108595 RepID=UPI000E18A611|nr:NAD-dependent epimerase/dehydratase family protein [Chromobacterium vaccinii]SUX30561.1 Cholesterol dehydrogenase [Chromobacterium vaccinii]